jgi:hypothetical protein
LQRPAKRRLEPANRPGLHVLDAHTVVS